MRLTAYNVEQFIEILASNEPAPGGGSAAALLGAVSAALGAMVAGLTAGKEKYQDKEILVQEILNTSQALMRDFLLLIDRDTDAFRAVTKALKMPKSTEGEKIHRRQAVEQALHFAAEVPFSTMEKAVQLLYILSKAVHNTNVSAISDLRVAAYAAMAALQGGWANVQINLRSIKDKAVVAQYQQAGNRLMSEGMRLAEEIQQAAAKTL